MDHTEQRLDATVRHALDGSAVLFVGAGVSFLTTDKHGRALPNGEELSRDLHGLVGIDPPAHPLDRIAHHFRRKFGNQKLFELLADRLRVKTVDPILDAIYRCPWRRIYTTNYDDGIELSRRGSRPVSSFSYDDPVEKVGEGAIIHINGFIDRVQPHTLDEQLILTDRSYAYSNLSSGQWHRFLLSDLKSARAVVFLGYSLADLDIARVLIADENIRRKTIFFISPDADEIEVSVLESYGHVNRGGVKELSSRIIDLKKGFVQSDSADVFSSLNEVLPGGKEIGAPSDRLFNQLVYGEAAIGRIISNADNFAGYAGLVPRQALTAYLETDGKLHRDLFITGELASGKTFACIQAAKHYVDAGYRVFWIVGGRTLERDLDRLSSMNGNVCVVCDAYRPFIDAVRIYLQKRPATHRIVLAERLTTHELLKSVFDDVSGFSPVSDVVLDRLLPGEIEHFDQLVNFSGLWGDQAGWSPNSRNRHIQVRLDASLYRLLLEIVRSQKVQQEIESLLEPIQEDESALRFFVTAFVMNILNYRFWINDWQIFYQIGDIRRMLARYRDQISHFVNVDAGQILPRSGVLSAYLLRRLTDNDLIIDCLVDMYDCATRNAFRDDEFTKIARDLRMYSLVEPLFSDGGKLQALKFYYETIRGFGGTQNNSDYWLQYGIATSIHGDIETAELAFKNAYSRERARPNPNLIRIDNYYARFEMEKAIDTSDSQEAFMLFRSGASKLSKQIFMDNNRHYPFKTGRSFSDIAGVHFGDWSPDQKAIFLKTCRSILEKAESWKRSNREGNRDVEFLINDIGKLLAAADRSTSGEPSGDGVSP